MKNIPQTLFISAVSFFLFITVTGCTKNPSNITFEKDRQLYIIDTKNSGVFIFDSDGTFSYSMGPPAAGPAQDNGGFLPAAFHLLFTGKASIAGLVWYDLNGDQKPDGEQGTPNIRVFVDIDGSTDYTPGEPTAVTDAAGKYEIAGLKAGTHDVYVDALPAGYVATTDNPLVVILTRYQKITDADFGIQDQSGTISGLVFNDSNQNGIKDPGEAGIGGVFLFWDINDNDAYDPGEPMDTTLQVSGSYLISGLAAGTHKIHLVQSSLPGEYYQDTVSGVNPTPLNLSAGEQEIVHFGYVLSVTITGFLLDSGTASGWSNITLFIDLNGNGMYDPGEPTALTDKNGMFVFTNLPPGTYEIYVLQSDLPFGHDLIIDSFTKTGAEGETLYINFLTTPLPVTIKSSVWNDQNGNGIKEPTEAGLSDVAVFADTNNNTIPDPGEPFTITDIQGNYTLVIDAYGPNWIKVDETTLTNNFLLTTKNNPVFRIFVPGETFTRADFGYQDRLAVIHSNTDPNQMALGPDKRLYVSNPVSNSVFIYDANLQLTAELKGLGRPLGVAVDSLSNIFVGNDVQNNIKIYSSDGIFLNSIGDNLIQMPNDLAFDRDDKLYIVDSLSATIWVYDTAGTLLGSIGSKGTGAAQFMFPVALAIHYRMDGLNEVSELYVADQATHLIKVFNLQGNFLRSFGGPIKTTMSGTIWQGLFSAIQSLAFDQSGMLHALDMNLDVVQILDPVTGGFTDFYYAYLLVNHGKLNLQLDLLINPAGESIMTNVATGNIEVLEKVNTPPAP